MKNQQELLWIVIVWSFNLHLIKELVPITTEVLNSIPVHGEVYSIQPYVIKFVSDL